MLWNQVIINHNMNYKTTKNKTMVINENNNPEEPTQTCQGMTVTDTHNTWVTQSKQSTCKDAVTAVIWSWGNQVVHKTKLQIANDRKKAPPKYQAIIYDVIGQHQATTFIASDIMTTTCIPLHV